MSIGTKALRILGTAVFSGVVLFLAMRVAAGQEDDKRVDRATDKALEYLSRMQDSDGSWPGVGFKKSTAIASIAVMAFMAKGNTPGEGRYGEIINKGIDYVLSTADPNTGYIAERGGMMYGHGAATLMLSEAAGMTTGEREKKMRETLEKAVKLILAAQQLPRQNRAEQGGWRYSPNSRDSDISVTGWQLLALRAAKNAGADVPLSAINDAVAYVKRSAAKGGGFAYQPGGVANLSRTGVGILSLEVCGQHLTPEAIDAGEWVMRNPPAWPDQYFYYGVYYCSQGMFQLGGKYWGFYQPRLEALLLGLQESDGSWPSVRSGEQAGPAYSTAMAVLALSVKYHYLPIYQK